MTRRRSSRVRPDRVRKHWSTAGHRGAAIAVIVAAGVAAAGGGSVSSSAAPSTAAAPARAPKFPPLADFNLGGRYWAVYLVLTRTGNDPRVAEARQHVLAAGYHEIDIVYGPIGCDTGAREGLERSGIRLDPNVDYGTAKLFFDTRQNAEAFVATCQPGVVGTTLMTWSCAD